MKTNGKKIFVCALLFALFVFMGAGIFIFQAKAADGVSLIMMEEGASVRYKEQGDAEDLSGLRFSAYVEEAYTSENATAEYGMLLIPEKMLGDEELTVATVGAVNKKSEVWRAVSDKVGYKKFSTVLYAIPETDYGTVVAVRAYIKDGDEYVYSSETILRSVGQVASYALAEGDIKESELLAYVDGALENLTVTETEVKLLTDETADLTVSVSPAELKAIFSSDDESVATVDENGKITAVGTGVCNVKVQVGSTAKNVSVSVEEIPEPQIVYPDFESGEYYKPAGEITFPAAVNNSEQYGFECEYTLVKEVFASVAGDTSVTYTGVADGEQVKFNAEQAGIYNYTITVVRNGVEYGSQKYVVSVGMDITNVDVTSLQATFYGGNRYTQVFETETVRYKSFYVATETWANFSFPTVNFDGYLAVFFDVSSGEHYDGNIVAGIDQVSPENGKYSVYAAHDVPPYKFYHGYFQATSGTLGFLVDTTTDFFLANVTLLKMPGEKKEITVTYDLNGGTSEQNLTQTFDMGSDAEFITATRTEKNATLLMWADVETGAQVNSLSELTKDTTLRARWQYDLDLSQLEFYSPDGGRTGVYNAQTGEFDLNTGTWARMNITNLNLADYAQVDVYLQTSVACSIKIGSSVDNESIYGEQTLTFGEWQDQWAYAVGAGGGHLMIFADDGVCQMIYIKQITVKKF